MKLLKSLIIMLFITILGNGFAYDINRTFKTSEAPSELKGINIKENLGDFIPFNLSFKDENNQDVRLGKYFQEGKPVLFAIVYYLCPNLCQLQLNGLLSRISQLKEKDQFEFVVLSMDHKEKPSLAKRKKEAYIKHYKNPRGEKNWHFLTGTKENIKKISRHVGFNFKWSEEQKQYAHVPVSYILTPKGQISKYLYGVELPEKTLKYSLIEASEGSIGGIMDRILLFCYQFNPRKSKYTIYAYNVMKIAGASMVLILAILLIPTWIRSRKST